MSLISTHAVLDSTALSPAALAAFVSAAIPAFFTPGPNNLMLMSSSARFGFGRTVPHMLGVSLGFPALVLLAGLGLGGLFAQLPWLEPLLRYLAAAYLVWMAVQLLGMKIGDAHVRSRPLRLHEAALFQCINPKGWAMAVSFIALLVAPGAQRTASLLLLSAGCLAITPLSCFTWMAFGQQLERWLRHTGAQRLLGAVLAALLGLAVLLLLLLH